MTFLIQARTVKLEAVLREPEEAPRGAAVLCHPHPAFGGTMDNRVIYRSAKAVLRAGLIALRFNFRGVGKSSGDYDHGVGEKEDVASAIDYLEDRYPGQPLVLVGFSFGSVVGLEVGCRDPRIVAMIGLGVPVGKYDFEYLGENRKPTLFLIGEHDEMCPRDRMDALGRGLPPTSRLIWIEGADHFFANELETVQKHITDFLRNLSFGRSS